MIVNGSLPRRILQINKTFKGQIEMFVNLEVLVEITQEEI